jgi:hypothetical protein
VSPRDGQRVEVSEKCRETLTLDGPGRGLPKGFVSCADGLLAAGSIVSRPLQNRAAFLRLVKDAGSSAAIARQAPAWDAPALKVFYHYNSPRKNSFYERIVKLRRALESTCSGAADRS